MTTHTTPAFKKIYAPELRELRRAPYSTVTKKTAREKLRKAVTENLRKSANRHASA